MTEKTNDTVNVIDLLPNNERHIIDIQNEVKSISSKMRKDELNDELSEEKLTNYNEKLIALLNKVGDYSQPAFDIRDTLERNYTTRYKDDPKKGKDLFIKHYASIHKPYDSLKNSIWKLLDLTLEEK